MFRRAGRLITCNELLIERILYIFIGARSTINTQTYIEAKQA